MGSRTNMIAVEHQNVNVYSSGPLHDPFMGKIRGLAMSGVGGEYKNQLFNNH